MRRNVSAFATRVTSTVSPSTIRDTRQPLLTDPFARDASDAVLADGAEEVVGTCCCDGVLADLVP